LSEFVDLNPGAWVVQNAANSGVGRWVIAFAKARGLRTVNIVRRPELTGELKEIGADVVVVDGPDVVDQIQNAIGDVQIRLALDGVGGTATGVLASIVSRGGTIVMYSAMSEAAITINPLDLIFKLVTVSGFHMAHPKFASKIPLACKQAAEMIEAKKMRVPVAAVYDITAIKDAVAHAGRGGKILLKVNNSGIF
jgi:NADPH:quinone reductase-like Zn-dependent oxidoreductase